MPFSDFEQVPHLRRILDKTTMAKVPSGFQAEPGQSSCGNSWPDLITVNGMIPGTGGYGSDRTQSLLPVATMPSGNDWYSYDGAAERKFIEDIKYRLGQVDTERFTAGQRGDLSLKEADAVRYLANLARNNLERVQNIYRFWNGELEVHPQTGSRLPVDAPAPRHPGSGSNLRSEWPLQAGVSLAKYMSECTNKSDEWVETSEGPRVVRLYYCHGIEIRIERVEDRERIRRLIIDAAAAVRCAHFGLWRMTLYNQALKKWREHQTGLGFGQRPGEYVPPLGFEQRPGEYVPPLGFGFPPELPVIPDPETPEPEEPEEPIPTGFGEPTPPVPTPPVPMVPVAEQVRSKPLPFIIAGASTLVVTGVVLAIMSR